MTLILNFSSYSRWYRQKRILRSSFFDTTILKYLSRTYLVDYYNRAHPKVGTMRTMWAIQFLVNIYIYIYIYKWYSWLNHVMLRLSLKKSSVKLLMIQPFGTHHMVVKIESDSITFAAHKQQHMHIRGIHTARNMSKMCKNYYNSYMILYQKCFINNFPILPNIDM